MDELINTNFMRWLTTAMVFGIIVFGLLIIYPIQQKTNKEKAKDADLLATIAAKKAEIAKLRADRERLKTDNDFLETVARRDQRVFPSELVFIFEKAQ